MRSIKKGSLEWDIWASRYGGELSPTEHVAVMVKSLVRNVSTKEAEALLGKVVFDGKGTYAGNNPHEDLGGAIIKTILDGKFIPAGRILSTFSSKNKGKRITPLNCYVIPITHDSIHGIFEFMKIAAETFSLGGGVGTDVSGLRPRGDKVGNAGVESSGPVEWMGLMDKTTGTIGQRGRIGATLISIHVNHPDIMEFIGAKHGGGLTNTNISVKVTDEFMRAVRNRGSVPLWYPKAIPGGQKGDDNTPIKVAYPSDCFNHEPLMSNPPEGKRASTAFFVASDATFRRAEVYATVKAEEIWDAITENAHATGDPGLILWDRMRRGAPHTGDNPLYAIHGTNPCGEEPLPAYGACCLGAINLAKVATEEELVAVTKIGVLFLDLVLSYALENNMYPQCGLFREIMSTLRIIGLGIMGLADKFILSGIEYGSAGSVALSRRIMEVKRSTEVGMTRVLGSVFSPESGSHMRNRQVGTVAPTGSTALLMGCSSGLEPVFSTSYRMKTKEGERQVDHWAKDSPYLIVAHDVNPIARVTLQAAIQEMVDGSISSTVNLPKTATVSGVSEVYMHAWDRGCKGITVFRDGCLKGGALSVLGEDTPATETPQTTSAPKEGEGRDGGRGGPLDVLPGNTLQIPYVESWYVTLNTREGEPFEVFVMAGKSGSDLRAWTEALGRVVSSYLQNGGNMDKIIKALKGISGEKTLLREGWIARSGPDAVSQALSILSGGKVVRGEEGEGAECPECGRRGYRKSGNCCTCVLCGYSTCG